MSSAASLGRNRKWSADLMPHAARFKVRLQPSFGETTFKVDRGLRSEDCPCGGCVCIVLVKHIGHRTTPALQDRLVPNVVVVIAGEIKISLMMMCSTMTNPTRTNLTRARLVVKSLITPNSHRTRNALGRPIPD